MASQSALRARVATIRELLAPDTSRRPCVTVRINHEPIHTPGPLLLTAGGEPPTATPPPAEPAEPRRRHDGHVCGPRCLSVSINYTAGPATLASDAEPRALPPVQLAAPRAPGPGYGDDAVGAPSGGDRGDVQCLPESAAGGRDVGPQSGPPRSPAPAAAPTPGLVDVPAREAVVEVERTAPPALVSPLEVEMRQEAAAVARAFARDVQQLVPWWLPVVPSPLAACAVPWCHHDATEHRGIRLRLACRVCGFQADQHDPDGIVLVVPQYARRVSPCGNYKAIYVDEADRDCCEHPGCTCRAYHRWVPFDPYDPRTASDMKTTEMARALAETREQLARLQAEIDAAQRERLRATSKPTDLGASPHGAPVFVEGEGP